MSDAIDVADDLAGDEGGNGGARPTSFLPPPTLPAAMLAGGAGHPGDGDGDGAGDLASAPALAAPPDERPAKPGLLIRLGHLFCGGPNGTR